MRANSLRVIITILFLLAGIVPVIVISIVNLVIFNRNVESEVMDSLSMLANLSESRLEEYCRGIEDKALLITSTQDVYASLNILRETGGDMDSPEWAERERTLGDLLKNATGELGLARIFITDQDGKCVYDTGRDLVGTSLQHRDYVQAALRGSPFWSPLFFSDIIDQNSLVFSSPVFIKGFSGKISGTDISGTMNILLNDEIIGHILHDQLNKTGKESIDTYLIDDQGLLLTNTCQGEYIDNAALNETITTKAAEILSEEIISGNTAFNTLIRYKNYLGRPVLGNLQVVMMGGNPVGMVVEMEQEEAFGGTYKSRNVAIVIAILMAMLIVRIGISVANSIAHPMQEIVAVASGIARGDLLVEANVRRKDEIGQLGHEFNKMSQGLRQLIRQAVDMATGVNQGSETVSAAAEAMSSSLEEISTTINEFAGNVQHLSNSTQQMAGTNQEIVKKAEGGRSAIDQAIEQMHTISRRVSDLQGVIAQVDQRSGDIGQILVVISDIAGQTNLLALNAAIEAARAGDQGRGFAVVAEEVRKLAEQSARAAAEIGELIQATQQESKRAMENMSYGVKEVEVGTALVTDLGSSFKGILQDVAEIGKQVEEAAAAAEELSAGSEEMAASAQEQSSTMQEVAASAEDLRVSSENLFGELNKFKYQ